MITSAFGCIFNKNGIKYRLNLNGKSETDIKERINFEKNNYLHPIWNNLL